MLLAYPLALVMVRGNALVGRALTVIVLAPLLINVVVRTYAWRVILANGENGVLNWTLAHVGLGPVQLLYTEWAVIIGSVHVFLPMMVLPLSAALGKINPAVEEAARTLGASSWQVFRRVTLPLSVPGLAVGATLVFSLTASSFVTPALLGGNFAKMLGTLVEEQILTVFDWPFGAAIATLLTVLVMVVNLASVWLVERRFPSRAIGGALMSEGGLGKGAVLLYAITARDHAVPAGAAAVPDRAVVLRHAVRRVPAAGLHAAMVLEGPQRAGLHHAVHVQRAARHLLGGRCLAARNADRDGAGALPISRARPDPGPGALAARVPDAGDRHRAVAAVHVDQLRIPR